MKQALRLYRDNIKYIENSFKWIGYNKLDKKNKDMIK